MHSPLLKDYTANTYLCGLFSRHRHLKADDTIYHCYSFAGVQYPRSLGHLNASTRYSPAIFHSLAIRHIFKPDLLLGMRFFTYGIESCHSLFRNPSPLYRPSTRLARCSMLSIPTPIDSHASFGITIFILVPLPLVKID